MNDNIGGMKPFYHKILTKFYDFETLYLIEAILVISSFSSMQFEDWVDKTAHTNTILKSLIDVEIQ